jgi:hypothetical protein
MTTNDNTPGTASPTTVGADGPKNPPGTLTLSRELYQRVLHHFGHCPFCGAMVSYSQHDHTVRSCGGCGTNLWPLVEKLLLPDHPRDEYGSYGFELKQLNLELDTLAMQRTGKTRDINAQAWPVRDAVFRLREYRSKLEEIDACRPRVPRAQQAARIGPAGEGARGSADRHSAAAGHVDELRGFRQ